MLTFHSMHLLIYENVWYFHTFHGNFMGKKSSSNVVPRPSTGVLVLQIGSQVEQHLSQAVHMKESGLNQQEALAGYGQ